MPGAFGLPKSERLRSKRAFTYLFEHGTPFRVGVLKFFYANNCPPTFTEARVSVAFSAPKRRFKRAVDRNYLKRRMREAYRLNKSLITQNFPEEVENVLLLISYQSNKLLEFSEIERQMIKGLRILSQRLSHAKESPNPDG